LSSRPAKANERRRTVSKGAGGKVSSVISELHRLLDRWPNFCPTLLGCRLSRPGRLEAKCQGIYDLV
jgi:hypothetical protein